MLNLFDKKAFCRTIWQLFFIIIFFKIGISFRGGRRKRFSQREPRRIHRINNEIQVPEVRLVAADGEPMGVKSRNEALALAEEQGVDLVEISPKAVPPVCKLIDYGKMLYALKKKEQQAKKATKAQELKGIRLTFRIDSGDLERQRKKAEEFLEDGHPVRIQLVMRGREKAHRDLAIEKMKKFVNSLSEISRLENTPKLSGHQILAILKPEKSS